jgi:hypothetical protein
MSFDPNAFMNSVADPMPTQMSVCPEGEYPFLIDSDPKGISAQNLKGVGKDSGKPYDFHQMEINCILADEAIKAKLNRDRVTVRFRVNLDVDASGKLLNGQDKNVSLGRLREALNQNKPGWKPADLLGAGPFIGKVEHTTVKGVTYADIVRVAKIS